LIQFALTGEGSIAGLDNGLQTSLESFQGDRHKAFNGLCLAVIRSDEKAGRITLRASSEGLKDATVTIESK
jgi:beta-galactosidase